uniref:CID domain-containing protein n=1 Tax=Panagrellus redivivus TaxID=6233 RepID=A0A7E4V082_PANRE
MAYFLNTFKATLYRTDDSRCGIEKMTKLAHSNAENVALVVYIVCEFIEKLSGDKKLFGMYILDSIVKHESDLTAKFRRVFAECIVELFVKTFLKVNFETRRRLHKCRSTWEAILPRETLQRLDTLVHEADSAWPVNGANALPSKSVGTKRPTQNENACHFDTLNAPLSKRICVENNKPIQTYGINDNVVQEKQKKEIPNGIKSLLREIKATGILDYIKSTDFVPGMLPRQAPVHHPFLDNVSFNKSDAVTALQAPRKACPHCGITFEDMKSEAFKRHVDTHIQKRLRERTVKKAEPHSWYMPINTWLAFDELTEVQKKPAKEVAMDIDDNSNADASNGSGLPPDVIATVAINKTCPVCHERFVNCFDNDMEVWRFENTVMSDGSAVHRSCLNRLSPTTLIDMQLESWTRTLRLLSVPDLDLWQTRPFTLEPKSFVVNPTIIDNTNKWVYTIPTTEQLQKISSLMGVSCFNKNVHQPTISMKVLEETQQITAIDVPHDGNCGYSALSVLLSGTIDNHKIIRQLILQKVASGSLPLSYYRFFGCGTTDEERKQEVITKAQQKMNPGNKALDPFYWWDESDSMAAAILFEINVAVFADSRQQWFLWNETALPTPFEAKMLDKPTVLLYLKDNHYMAIVGV